MRKTRALGVVAGVVVGGALVGSGWVLADGLGDTQHRTNEQRKAAAENCEGIHRLVEVLDTIMESGDEQVRRYVKEGTLTPRQGQRADAEREKARKKLRGADCS